MERPPGPAGDLLRPREVEITIKLPDITLARNLPASAERVFDVWVDPNSRGGPWFGAERVVLNPAVDGLFNLAVKHQGRTWPLYGRFLQIDRPRLLEYTWMSEATKRAESIVTVRMEAREEQTEVTLPDSGGPDDEMGRQHQHGWA